nr:SWI/SNF complex subunit SWI3A [Ipomoea batatas]
MEGSREPNPSKLFSDGPPDHDLYTIPSYTSWFSWNNIHEVERLSLGEFFDGNSITRTPRIYKEYRDFIISKYREDSTRKLTFTEVRKSLVGDICVLQKVFTFLEKWGLINFDPSKPEPVQAGAGEEEEEDEKWRVRVEEGAPHGVRVIAAPNSLKPLAPLPPPPSLGVAADAAESGLKMPPLASYSDVYAELLEQQRREILVCGNCKESCASGHYEYSKEGSFILCEKCFKDGNFDKDKSADDFKFIESGNHQVVWTEAETLLLFESVLKHGDDWDLVAQNVKTKNKLECISKLIQLPFGDLMLGSAHRKNRFCDTNGDVNGLKQAQLASSEPQATMTTEDQPDDFKNEQQNGDNENQEPPTKRRCSVPISGPSSSLMKQVAHISTVVGPWVTSSATEAAVTALCYENQCSREIFDDSDSFGDESESSLENNEQERDPQAEGAQIDKTSSDTQDKSSLKSTIPLTLQMRAATAAALGGAAAHAKLLADQEHREMEYLVSTLVDTQLKKLQRKVKHMEELELIMENQQRQMKELEATILDERLDALQGIFSSGSVKSKGDASTIIKSQNNIDAAV